MDDTLSHGAFIYIGSISLCIFAVCNTIYQLYLIITIQKNGKYSGGYNSEGEVMSLQLSPALYVSSIIFGVMANALMLLQGLYGFRVMKPNMDALKRLKKAEFDPSDLNVKQ